MAIQYVGGVSAGRNGNSNATTTQSLTALTGGIASQPSAGDLVIVCCAVGSQGRNNAQAISGYSTLGTQLNASAVTYDTSMQVSYKRMTATPDTSITIPAQGDVADGQSWAVMVFRSVDASTPFDVSSVSATGTGTGRPNPAAITPTTSGAWIVVAAAAAAAVTTTAFTFPADLSDDAQQGTGADTNDSRASLAYHDGWTSGEYDPAAYTDGTNGANDSWAAWTMALRPAATFEGTGATTLPLLTASGAGQQIFDFGWFPRSFTNNSPTAFDAWAWRRGAWHGTGAATLPLPTGSGSGTVSEGARTGTGTPTLPLLTTSGSATFWSTFTGTGTPTLPLLTVAADASFWTTLTATGAATLPLITASGTGLRFRGRIGSGAATLPLLTASGTGEIIDLWGSTAALTLPVLTASGTGTRTGTRTGSGAATLPLITSAGSGLPREPVVFSASVALTLPLITVTGAGFQRYRDDTGSHSAYDLALIMFDPSDSATVQVLWANLAVGISSVAYTLPTGLTQVDGGIDNSRDPRISRVRISGATHGYTYPCVATATLQDDTTATVRFTIRGFNA